MIDFGHLDPDVTPSMPRILMEKPEKLAAKFRDVFGRFWPQEWIQLVQAFPNLGKTLYFSEKLIFTDFWGLF